MTTVLRWLSEQPLHERPRWSSQRPPVAPTFALESLDASTPSALAFTRATACSGTDYQGNVFQALSGEMTRQGLRRVRNLFSASTTLSTQGVTVEVGAVYVVSFYGTGSITFTGAATGSLSGTGATTRVSTTVTATTTTLTCTVAGSVTSAQCQRARPGQTTPDEYVSVGVLASPYHGSYVDGVKYFDTDEHGAKITGTGAGWKRRGNRLLQSEDFGSASWTAVQCSVAAGSGDWFTISEAATTNYHYVKQTTDLTGSAGQSIIFSVDLQSNTVSYAGIHINDGSSRGCSIDLSSGALGTPYGGATASVTALAGGGYRLTVQATLSAAAYNCAIYISNANSLASYAGSTANKIDAKRPMIEVAEQGQTTPSDYIPTTTAAVTVVEKSSDVAPVEVGIPVVPAQTNRITYSSTLTSGWTDGGTGTGTAAFDAQVGAYTQLRSIGASGSADWYYASSGHTGAARTEPGLMLRAVSTSGTLNISQPDNVSEGLWAINLALVSTTRFEWIDRFHPAVTVTTEFVATAGGASGIRFYAASGTLNFDVAIITQIEGERCYRPILSAGSATATNDELLSWVWTVHATQNQGSFVFDFIPKAETAIGVNYLGGALWVYRNGGNAALYSYDGTTASSFGDQIEGARTTLAGSWETGVGRYGYRDGVAKFSGTSYDGAWLSTSMLIYGPQLLKSLQIYPEALTPAQLAAISAL